MTPLPFNGPLFVHDFVRALDRAEKASKRGRPHYDQRAWFRCLAEADEHDHGHAWRAKCDARDAASTLLDAQSPTAIGSSPLPLPG